MLFSSLVLPFCLILNLVDEVCSVMPWGLCVLPCINTCLFRFTCSKVLTACFLCFLFCIFCSSSFLEYRHFTLNGLNYACIRCYTALIIKISFTFPVESIPRFIYKLLNHINQMLRVAFFTWKVPRNFSVDFVIKRFLRVCKRPGGFLN
jgi:hypothetical protein